MFIGGEWQTRPDNNGKAWEFANGVYQYKFGFDINWRGHERDCEVDLKSNNWRTDHRLLTECHDAKTPMPVNKVVRTLGLIESSRKDWHPVVASTSGLTENARRAAREADVTIVEPWHVLGTVPIGAIKDYGTEERDESPSPEEW